MYFNFGCLCPKVVPMESKYIIYPKEEDIPLKTSELDIKILLDKAPFKYQLSRVTSSSTKDYLYAKCTQCKSKISWSRAKNLLSFNA